MALRTALSRRIRRVRRHFGESTAAFGARFLLSDRAIEDYEQGRRTPHPLAVRLLESLEREIAAKPRRARPAANLKKAIDNDTAAP